MKKKILAIVLSVLPMIFFCGCFDQQIFENTAIILYAGAETTDKDDTFLFSIAAAESEGKDGSLLILSKEDELLESAISSMNDASANPLRSGKLQDILFSEELAKKGIANVSDANHLDASNRFLADYVVVQGSPKEMLQVVESLEKKNKSYGYLEQLLENASDAGLCPNTLHQEFDIYFQTEGIDPILPLMSYNKENETIKVEGTALFHEDRYVGALSAAESRYLSILMSSADIISVKMKDIHKEGHDLTLNIIEGFRHADIDIINNELYITFKIRTRSYFTVSDWAEISQTSRKTIESELEKKLEHRCTEIYQKLQECGCDPTGITAKVRAKYNDFYNSHNMEEVFANAHVTFDINNTLINQKD
ncbi:MAG: Ger(x)C family spore germination protein [Firmicutes bacterium]|nr:Ger(x)C family spore germination protein [Bacillota bacterium]